MLELYPKLHPNTKYHLQVNGHHKIYVEESGNEAGIPVIVVHGGPGYGSHAYYRQFFDPSVYRIICYDQRGAGLSTPYISLEDNNTQTLVEDIEKIRVFLEIDRFALFGGSWGATLSLLYAIKYPQHVTGLILHSIFLARENEHLWFIENGAKNFYPEYWNSFVSELSPLEQRNILKSYFHRLTEMDDFTHMAAAKAWTQWRTHCAGFHPQTQLIDHPNDAHFSAALATIECHFMLHQYFLGPNDILDDIAKIQGIPGFIIHGRYDVITPIIAAYDLAQAWPLAEYYVIRDGAHSILEPNMTDALILATQKFAQIAECS